MMRAILLMGAALFLSGCATDYKAPNPTDAWPDRNAGKLFRVAFQSNNHTSIELTQKYALYRAAEAAKARNKPYFILYDSLSAGARNIPSSGALVGRVYGVATAVAWILPLDAPASGAHHTDNTLSSLKPIIDNPALDKK